jgi:hypothetical protein
LEHSPSDSFHALPKFMPPSMRGETRTAAAGLRRRCLPSKEMGLEAVMKAIAVSHSRLWKLRGRDNQPLKTTAELYLYSLSSKLQL